MQWNILEVLHRHVVEPVVGILHGDHIVVAALGVDPIGRRNLPSEVMAVITLSTTVLGREPDQAGLFAVDVERNAGIIQILRNVDAGHAGHGLDLRGQLLRPARRRLAYPCELILNVDGSGQALIDDAVHQAAGLVVSRQFRHLAGERVLHAAHVFIAADAVIFIQAGLHKGRVH